MEVKNQHVSTVTRFHLPGNRHAMDVTLSEERLQGTVGSVSCGSHRRKRSCPRRKSLPERKNIRSKGTQVNSLCGKFIKAQTVCLCWRIKCKGKAESEERFYSLGKQGSAWAAHCPKSLAELNTESSAQSQEELRSVSPLQTREWRLSGLCEVSQLARGKMALPTQSAWLWS